MTVPRRFSIPSLIDSVWLVSSSDAHYATQTKELLNVRIRFRRLPDRHGPLSRHPDHCSVCLIRFHAPTQQRSSIMPRSIDYEAQAAKLINNWKQFDSFGLSDRDSFEGRTIVYTSSRDSRLIERCNAQAIAERMKRHLGRTCETFSASHWAIGHVDGYAIQVYTTKGKVTAAFKEWCDIQAALEEYPLLDESAYSEAEHEEAYRICEQEGWDFNDEEAYGRALAWANE